MEFSGEDRTMQCHRPRAAFFDFDKTILAGDSQEMEFLSLFRQPNSWPTSKFPIKLIQMGLSDALAKHHLMDPKVTHGFIFDAYKGIPFSLLQSHAIQLYETAIKRKLFPAMIEQMKKHKARGHRIILLSASAEHLLQPFVDDVDVEIDAWRGTNLEIDNSGICTGQPDGPVMIGERKAEAAQEFGIRYGFDLSDCYFYSDHHADLPALQIVGKPVAVNPTKNLYEVATESKWHILKIKLSKKIEEEEEEERKPNILCLMPTFLHYRSYSKTNA
jgi:fatty acyl-CoA reductase